MSCKIDCVGSSLTLDPTYALLVSSLQGQPISKRPAMFADRIEGKWIDAFCEVFERCAVKRGDTTAILSETQSRALNVHLA
jgi:hypothetical protein